MMHNNFFMYIASRGQGKTWLTALFCVVRCILFPKTKICVASATRSQANEVLLKITEDFMKNYGWGSENLRREITYASVGANKAVIEFANGSWIRVVTASDSGRGARANILIVDEFRMVDLDTINTVLRRFLTAPRQPNYLNNPKYAHLLERNKELYMSSAWLKINFIFYTATMPKSCRETASSALLHLYLQGDALMRKGTRKHFFNEDYFENIDTEEKAYWLGFIAADGCIVKSSEYNSYRLYINLGNIDEGHLQKFLNSISAHDIKIQRYTSTSGFSNKNGTKTSRIVLNSLKLCKDLSKYNICERKSYDIKMPEINNRLIPHYLRGYVDGDGSFYCHYDENNNRYRYSFEIVGGSRMFMEQVQSYLTSNNIKTNIYIRKTNSSTRLMSASKAEILKIIELLYSNANIYLDRKFNKINEIKNIAV